MPDISSFTSSRPFTTICTSAHELPQRAWKALEAHPRNANIILPQLQKNLNRELQGDSPLPGQYWLVYGTSTSVQFIVSCTQGPLGTYPIFIFTTLPFSSLTPRHLASPITDITQELLRVVPPERVYSVFAPEPITKAFATIWPTFTGILPEPVEYYSAMISYCTRKTLSNRVSIMDSLRDPTHDYELRLATLNDVPEAAYLCYGFASESEPFTLNMERAYQEARLLVEAKQLWVHRINEGDKSSIASIVAVTRNTDAVATISKVYTSPQFRKRKCAERLVRHVCDHLLNESDNPKESIVLYVAHENKAASTVYHRVGFAGLDPTKSETRPKGVDPWLEIGFDQSQVELGHW